MITFIKKWFGSSVDFKNMVENGALILDVRTKAEFNNGHIKGAKHIPLDILKKEIEQVRKLNKPVITVCQSGARSSIAKNLLKNAGIEAYNGGSWQSLMNK